MTLADEVAGASGAIDALRAIAAECRAARRSLEASLYADPAIERAHLQQACAAVMNDQVRVVDNGDPFTDGEVRERLCSLVEEAELGLAGWWVLAHAIDGQREFRSRRTSLLRRHWEGLGRMIGVDQYELQCGDPISSSVLHRLRVPAKDRVDRFGGIWFVPDAADGHRVIFDYRLARAVNPVVRPNLAPDGDRPDVATVHPFAYRDLLDGSSLTDRGWAYPIRPLADAQERAGVLAGAVGAATQSRARIVMFPELVGSRADSEKIVDAWKVNQTGPGLLLAGTFHEDDADVSARENVAVLAGFGPLGGIDATCELSKNMPQGGLPWSGGDPDSPREQRKDARREDIPYATVPVLRVLAGKEGSIGVLICRDALEPPLVDLLCELACDLILCPAATPKVEAFEPAATHIAVHGGGQFVLANGLGYGTPVALASPRVGGDVGGGSELISTVRSPTPGIAIWRTNSHQPVGWRDL